MDISSILAKGKVTQAGSFPASKQGGTDNIQSILAKASSTTPPNTTPSSPVLPPQLGQGTAGEFAGGVVRAVVEPLMKMGAGIEGLLSKGVEAMGGKVAPSASGQDAMSAAQSSEATPMTGAGTAGRVVGQVLPYLTGAGEEEGAVLGAKTLAKTGSKVAGWLAEHVPTFIANTGIGTVQAGGDVKKGAETAAFAEAGQAALRGAGRYISGIAGRAKQAIADAFTPKLGAKGYEKAAASGIAKVQPMSIFGKAGVVSDSIKSVQNAIEALDNVASTLGKKAKNIISSGTGSITRNFNNVTKLIGEYAQKHVQPFLDSAGVNYNFSDLKGALDIVKLPADLSGEALKTYNYVREEILNAVASKVSPGTTGGKSLSALRTMASDGGVVPAKITKGDTDFWDARKIIDDIGNLATKGKIFNSPEHTGATRAWQDLRAAYKNYLSDAFRYPGQMEKVNAANDFLSTKQTAQMDKTGWDISQFEKQFGLTPSPQSEANAQQWDSFMKNMEGLYQGRSNIASKLSTEKGKSMLDIWMKSTTAKLIGGAFGGTAIFEAAKKYLPTLP